MKFYEEIILPILQKKSLNRSYTKFLTASSMAKSFVSYSDFETQSRKFI